MIGCGRRLGQGAGGVLAVLGLLCAGAPARGEEPAEKKPSALEQEKARGKAFLEQAAQEEGAVRAKSGFVFLEEQKGTGLRPWPTNTVKVHYTGRLIDGKVFDSSVERGKPAVFELQHVIRCWTEGLQMMKAGGKAKLVCPPDLAYGDQASGGIPAGATLVFEVELLAVQ